MPYFIKLEPTSENDCGMFSKGYRIYMQGKKVLVEWGPVFVRKGRTRKVCWAGPNMPQSKQYKFDSLSSARHDYEHRIRRRLRWKKYKKLSYGRILKFRKSLLN